jgi:HEAT repeat protein
LKGENMSTKILLAVILLGCVVVSNHGCQQKEEPIYEGKSLSQWIQQLGDVREDARIKAATALGEIKDKGAAEPLAKAILKEELGSGPILAFMVALMKIGPDLKTTNFLAGKLQRGGEGEDAKAALALGAMGGEKAILVILQRLSLERAFEEKTQKDNPRTSGFRSLVILGMKMREDNAKDITEILRRQSRKEAVTGGYLDLGYEAVNPMLAMAVLKEIGPAAINPVTELLQDKDKRLRSIAVLILGVIGQEKKETASTICPHLVLRLKDGEISKIVLSALEQISGKSFGENQEDWDKWCKSIKQ